MKITGIYCPIITPFVEGKVATDKLAENLDKWNATGLDGYVILGSTGEAIYLTPDEKMEVIKIARKHISSNKKFIVGTGYESTTETIEFTKQVADLGAELALVVTPHYYKALLFDECIYRYFVDVADKSPIPILLYNVPKFTGINMNPSLVVQLASHPNIVGIKDSADKISQLNQHLKITSSNFNVLIGNDTLLLPGLFMGAQGAVVALSNVVPNICVEILRLFNAGLYEKARLLYFKIEPLAKVLISTYGIAGIKAALNLLGYYGGQPRKPLLPLDQELVEKVRKLLEEVELL